MLRRSARRSGHAADEPPGTVTTSPPKRGRGGRGRGRGRGKSTPELPVDPTEEANMQNEADDPLLAAESADTAAANSPSAAAIEATSIEAAATLVQMSSLPSSAAPAAPPAETDGRELNPAQESVNSTDRSDQAREDSRVEEGDKSKRVERKEGEEQRKEGDDRPESKESADGNRSRGGRRDKRRSRTRDREYDDDYPSDGRRSRGSGYGMDRGERFHHYGGGGHDGGYGGYGGGRPQYGPPPGYGRGRGGRGGGFRGGWRGGGGGGGGWGGPGGPPPGHPGHPGMMGPPQGWDGGYDQMGPPPPHMMQMRGPMPPYGMMPPHGGMPPMQPMQQQQPHGMPPHGMQQQQQGMQPQHGMVPPPPPHGGMPPMPPSLMGGHHQQQQGGQQGLPPVQPCPPLPPGPPPIPPPPPPVKNTELEGVKTKEEIAVMKAQIAKQIEEAREKAIEGKEKEEKKKREEEEAAETNEEKERRVKQASAMLRAALFRKSTGVGTAAVKAAAAPAASTATTTESSSSLPTPVPPPSHPTARLLTAMASSLGNAHSTTTPSQPKRPAETKDVFGKDEDGGLFGERKPTLSLPSDEDRAEMQLYNDVLNAPHPNQDVHTPRKSVPSGVPAPVLPPQPVSTPATISGACEYRPVRSPPESPFVYRERQERMRQSQSRSPITSRSPRRAYSRSPSRRDHRLSPRRGDRTPMDTSRSPRRGGGGGGGGSPRSSPRRERERMRRSRSRSHGRHRSRSRSKERGERGERGGGRTRHDSGHSGHHSSRRVASPGRDVRAAVAARRRGYELSPVRSGVRSSGHRSGGRRSRTRSPRRERSREKSAERSRERRRTPERFRVSSNRRGRGDDEREEKEKRRSEEIREERRRKDMEDYSKELRREEEDRMDDDGKENSTPGHDEQEIDRVIEMEDIEEEEGDRAEMEMTLIEEIEGEEGGEERGERGEGEGKGEEKGEERDDQPGTSGTVLPASGAVDYSKLRPDPYDEIEESVFFAEIKDRNDYGGACFCSDGVCGVSCLLRYLTVECDRSTCPSGKKCTNRAMQKRQGAKVEVFHTGSEKGFGVKAMESIKKGAFIIEYIGDVITNKEGERRKKRYAKEFPLRRHHYLMTVTDSKNQPFIIDATKQGNVSRFLNHSCEPNAICDKWSVKGQFRMGFYAKQEISAGEEITFDYRFQNYGRTLIECACGTPSCRRFLSSKEAAKEEEERLKSGRERVEESSSSEEEEEEDEEEEEEMGVEEKKEERKRLSKERSTIEEAERLIEKGVLTTRKQQAKLSGVMIRITPAHQSLRTRLIRLLIASGKKNTVAYTTFLKMTGRKILQKYLTLEVDSESTFSDYHELIPLLEAILELLHRMNASKDFSKKFDVQDLLPQVRLLAAQSEVPDVLVVHETIQDIISGIEEERRDDDEEDQEWCKRWTRCTTLAAEMEKTWEGLATFLDAFKIPKKRQDEKKKQQQRQENTGGTGGIGAVSIKPSSSVSSSISSSSSSTALINPFPYSYSRTIKQTESAAAKGWQSYEKKERRTERTDRTERDGPSRDWKDFGGKDRYSGGDRGTGSYRKRKWDREDDFGKNAEKREERRESMGSVQKKEEKGEKGDETRKEINSATNSYDSPRDEEDAMQISPNIDDKEEKEKERERERERIGGEPDAKRPAFYSPLPSAADAAPAASLSLTPVHRQSLSSHQQHLLHQTPGPMPPPIGTASPWGGATPGWGGSGGGWHGGGSGWPSSGGGGQGGTHWGAQTGQMGYGGGGGYANGIAAPPALSYFNLAPAPGSSLTDELVFWQGSVKYCQQRADEIQHRLDQARELELKQQLLLQHLQQGRSPAAVATPAAPAASAAPPSPAPPPPTEKDKPTRPNLNDRLAALTGVTIKSGGGGGGGGVALPRTPPESSESGEKMEKNEKKGPSTPPPRPPSRPSESELASAKCVRTKDGRLIPIASIAKYCKVHNDGATYYYNKFTRSPTWEVPAGESANSEDELEVDTQTSKASSISGESSTAASRGGNAAAAAAAAGIKTPSGRTRRPQTPPEEPSDPISSVEVDEKQKLHRKSEFKTRSGDLLKRYVKASMFGNVEEFKKTLRKIIHGCIDKEQKLNPRFNFEYSEDVRHRMVEYTKKYVHRHKLKPLSYPEGIAD